MRIFEALIILLLLSFALRLIWSGHAEYGVLGFFAALFWAALTAHLVFEGAHWQMAPAYLGGAVLTLLLIKGSAPRLAGWSVAALVVCSCAFVAILPIFRLPAPTGPFGIGTRVLYLTDASRVDARPDGHKAHRELVVQVWYPAEVSHDPLEPYRRRAETTLLSSYQSVTRTHARTNAPVRRTQDPFPVLLFNPAWNGRRTQNTFLVEDLASHGYFVVGIDHAGNSGPTQFSDGRIGQPSPTKDMDFAANSLEEIQATGDAELRRQTADDIFVLDQLQLMANDPHNAFYQRVNTGDAGALGHSFGGAVAAQACYQDGRIRSALDLDGSLFGQVASRGLRKPFMFITEDVKIYTDAEIERMGHVEGLDARLDRSDAAMFERSSGYRVYLRGSTHASFTDAPFFSPLRRLSGEGRVPRLRQSYIIRELARAFFDKTLLGKDSPSLESARFPEAAMTIQITLPARS